MNPHSSWLKPEQTSLEYRPHSIKRFKNIKKERERESDRLEIGEPQFDKRDDHRFPKDALYSLCKLRDPKLNKLRLAQDTKRYIAITHALTRIPTRPLFHVSLTLMS